MSRKEQESLLIALEREEEYINNMLQQSLQHLVQEKIEIENALEQEQEFIVNTMSRQLAKALNDKL
jgi:coiled-coil domain-containing protein 6